MLGDCALALCHIFNLVLVILLHKVTGLIAPGCVEGGAVEPGLAVATDGCVQTEVIGAGSRFLVEASHIAVGRLVEVIASLLYCGREPYIEAVAAGSHLAVAVPDGKDALLAVLAASAEEVCIVGLQVIAGAHIFELGYGCHSLVPFTLEQFALCQQGICGATVGTTVPGVCQAACGIGKVGIDLLVNLVNIR